MIPGFKFYFYPLLLGLKEKGALKVAEVGTFIADYFSLTKRDLSKLTKSGKIKCHQSRVYYCVSYCKKLGFIDKQADRKLIITSKGLQILQEKGNKLTLTDIRTMPEFMEYMLNSSKNKDVVIVKGHLNSNGKYVAPYCTHKDNLREDYENIV